MRSRSGLATDSLQDSDEITAAFLSELPLAGQSDLVSTSVSRVAPTWAGARPSSKQPALWTGHRAAKPATQSWTSSMTTCGRGAAE